jgi:hypothetical protein
MYTITSECYYAADKHRVKHMYTRAHARTHTHTHTRTHVRARLAFLASNLFLSQTFLLVICVYVEVGGEWGWDDKDISNRIISGTIKVHFNFTPTDTESY